jgi:dihydroorotase
MAAADTLTIRRPDDWHVHFRDGAVLAAVAPLTARQFARAVVMPNLVPPVTSVAAARAYRDRILDAVGTEAGFTPLMTCYLTDNADADEIARGFEETVFAAVKLYPAHATTNSAAGVTDIANVHGVLARLEKIGMPLLVHGETVGAGIDVFDREQVFIERTLGPLVKKFPGLKIVFEHITTEEAVDFVRSAPANVAATVTAHHLMINRNAIFEGGIRPHYYCLPIAKREQDRLALKKAVASGSAKFFLGTDTAPHAVSAKETACGCAGIFTAANALELYAQVFDEENALDKFEAFASLNGPAFYGLPVNEETVTLRRAPTTVPKEIKAGSETVRPFLAGQTLPWSVEG